MRVRGEVWFLPTQAARSLRGIPNPCLGHVHTGDADHCRVRVRATNRTCRADTATTIWAITTAVASGKQDVSPIGLETGHDHVKRMRRVVTVIAGMSGRKIPSRREHSPTVGDDHRTFRGGHGGQDGSQLAVGLYRVRQQPRHDR